MGSVIVNVKLRGKGEVVVKALVNTGFYGDIITRPKIVENVGVDFRYERDRRLPDGRIVRVKYGIGEIELFNKVTGGDIEVWEELKLPEGVDALLGVTALEKLGYKVNPRTGKLEEVELYLI